ncbi:peroxisomal succinyl-coenzyme A thioesterase-like [Hoplias malabaricus]|uniref:peroxisomal succinyl-coenzyme A thioesterase-like n=1 Tax=Hoplias malabaricus TaxID=27720 RepID=UPI0034621DB7
MGLLWSLRPVPGSRTGLRLRRKNVIMPMVFHISVYDGHISQGFNQLSVLESRVIERWYMAPGVRRVDVQEKGVRGTLFIPPGPGPFPGVLDLFGVGGVLVEYRSALLASHGFASLALEYFFPKEAKATALNISYFETAYQILQDHPMVRRDKLAVFGLSFGAFMTLALVTYSKIIKPQCCVCISGSHFIPENKSLPKIYADFRKSDKLRIENNQLIWRNIMLPIPADPSIKVDVGQIKCPLLFVNGDDDQNWPTVECAEDMAQIMEKAENRHLLQVLTYPGAGHLIEVPYTPHHRASNFILQGSNKKVLLVWGGQTKPHADAQEDSWQKILAFFKQHLYQVA